MRDSEPAILPPSRGVDGRKPRDFAWLDEHLRESWLMSNDWNCHLTRGRLTEAITSTRFKSALLGLALCHGSGHVRERAAKLLGEHVIVETECRRIDGRFENHPDSVYVQVSISRAYLASCDHEFRSVKRNVEPASASMASAALGDRRGSRCAFVFCSAVSGVPFAKYS